jgi:Di-haem cytochrome c peroxidase
MPQVSRGGEWRKHDDITRSCSFIYRLPPLGRPLSHLHRSRAARRPPPKRTSAKRRRLGIGLIAAIAAAALSFGLKPLGKQARSETRSAPDEAARPAQPKSLEQVGLPAELTRQAIPPDNPQAPDKITLGEKLFFDGRLSADGTVACSTCHDPARAFTDGRPTSIVSMVGSASATHQPS